ncbi:hypothetical protein CGZ97_10310 [Enemella evansiae]|nr:hypothetical protein CGZ97_10310 [Enemella evansiae]
MRAPSHEKGFAPRATRIPPVQPPGWYPDPSGQPQSFRFWDGQVWTPVTTRDPNTPWPTPAELGRPGLQPLGQGADRPAGPSLGVPPAPTGPAPQPPRSTTPLVIGGAVFVLIAVIIGIALWRTGGGQPSPAPSASAAPSVPSAAGTPSGPVRLRCDNGNGNATNLQAPSYSSTGARYDAPSNFAFRYSKSYWEWADDFSAFGVYSGGQEAGIVLGGLSAGNGFTDTATAGEQVLSCMEGTLSSDKPTKAEGARTEPIEIGGMQGHRTTARMSSPSEARPLLVTITVVDSGQPGKLAQLITFVREGNPVAAQVEQAASTLRRG